MVKFDEMYTRLPYEFFSHGAQIRDHYKIYDEWLARQPGDMMAKRREEAEMIFRRVGITFAVYGAKDENGFGTERLIPFDLIPRIIPAHEWAALERGLVQRVTALNRFLHDVYHDQAIIKAGLIEADQITRNAQFRPQMVGVDVPNQIYSHIAGVDIVRAPDAQGNGEYYVLEDNLRVPSGVSYMLENRKMMMRLFPDLFNAHHVAPVAHYPDLLLETLRASSPPATADPTVVVLTPGMYNSAYFEHAFLAQQMGVELVEGQDLFVKDNFVYMRTTRGPMRVDVIYRRVDDDFLDPLVFRPSSTLGCAGLLEVYRAGNVSICNAAGTGIADDKSIYPYVPQMIEFYLGEKPILNNVPTHICRRPDDLKYVLAHLKDLVIKEVHGAGGYGMLVGPASTTAEIEEFRQALLANPGGYIAQPTLSLSSCPTFVESGIAPRHIDLRPFVLSGKEVQMVPGGLTRVALKEGSLVVNSSQGGGTKDTWVLEMGARPVAQAQLQSQLQSQSQSSAARS
ncbi:circularly permuted type 2 ATP-grasp protein [Rhodoferax sediminis]|uniref:Circularly permuted type 2 ATP-grasp protein n=1 Tax=Rhodoferax sediminis TaxID=2509614 RepID=A0A515DCN0_9BURK|nr:circularly permuted type 2 ATP-grasp protein [Rhodoferax sediminis]QDL38178.1 circularly permuted type 2 ATP-grasp protein [Rhodoferax sediminis]